MGFYDLDKAQRDILVEQINKHIEGDIRSGKQGRLLQYFSDTDTYIRKTAYLAIGKLYIANKKLAAAIIRQLEHLLKNNDPKVRQTVVNAAGEIGKWNFAIVKHFFDTGLFDEHHSVRNAVIGSMKKMGEKNPAQVIEWSRAYLHHPDKEIRREICHGIELRGRTHPEDILPLLKELQYDKIKRVRWTLVHVIGQISYKKGCLETVMGEILTWENKDLVADAIGEIIDVHYRYKNFSCYTQDVARKYIESCLTP
ncbi:MAG: HEAT repeat domain-containing protein [Chitinophagales bacterium]